MATFDPWAQLKVLDVQACDSSIDQLTNRLRKLPEAEAVSRLKSDIGNLKLREIAGITEVADRELDVRKAENDVEAVRLRSTKDQNMLDSGQVSDAKALTELQHEVESLSRRQADLEDTEIEILQQLEDAQKSLAEVRAALKDAEAQLVTNENALTVAVAEIEVQIADQQKARVEHAAGVPEDLMKLYEKLRADNGGIGAAKLHQGRCDGCRIQLNPVALAAARNAADNELLRCEECRAILVRTLDSGL
jgi:predicted  nucleic acid-binding Zn-ribbon protein